MQLATIGIILNAPPVDSVFEFDVPSVVANSQNRQFGNSWLRFGVSTPFSHWLAIAQILL